jgi:peptide-methionine (S)-S-oxide reductase
VGYAGGTFPKPAYSDLRDHSESIQIDYDPTQISYEELLDLFWNSHSPTTRPWSRQYASLILYHNEEQRRLAEASRDRQVAELGKPLFTEIIPYTEFYLAEDYHQKYRLQGERDLLEELRAIFPDDRDFINSTAVARVNGYLGGNGSLAQLQAEIGRLGLSPAAQEKLLDLVSARER